jgi:O-antigen/teichoic acid export membrane protein
MMLGPVMWVANTELTLTAGFEAMGYFGVAFVFYQAIRVIPRSIVIPLIPRISELSVIKASAETERIVVSAIRLLSVSLFPLMFGLAMFSEYVIELLYGEYYVPASGVMYLLVSATYLYTLASVIGALLSGTGRMWVAFALNGLWAVAFMILVFLTVPEWGLIGMGAAFAGSYALHMVTSYYTSSRVLGVRLTRAYVTTALAAFMFAVGYACTIWRTYGGMEVQVVIFLAGVTVIAVEGRSALTIVFRRLMSALRPIVDLL